MDDITDKLKGLLDSPEGLEQIKSIASSFLDKGSSEPEHEKEHHSKGREHSSDSPLSALGKDIDINMIFKIKSALDSFNVDDEKFGLLHALKPHLRPARQIRVDEAIKILRLINLMPLFKDNGFL